MLLARFKIANTGNSVANYIEEIHRCDICQGSGYNFLTEEEIWEIMDNTTVEFAIREYRKWCLNDGKLPCKECDGMGEFTVRI